jgi:hypothetical protein
MKKILIALTLGCISFSALIGFANAQSTGNVYAFTATPTFVKSIQRIAAQENPSYLDTSNARLGSTISVKAIKDFKTRFAAATNEKWFTVTGGYMTYFKLNGFSNRVFYDKKGRWQSSLTCSGEDKLPRELRAIVKSTYFDFTITQVEDVETIENGVYLVYLEDKTSIKVIRITKDGVMDTMQDFIKG